MGQGEHRERVVRPRGPGREVWFYVTSGGRLLKIPAVEERSKTRLNSKRSVAKHGPHSGHLTTGQIQWHTRDWRQKVRHVVEDECVIPGHPQNDEWCQVGHGANGQYQRPHAGMATLYQKIASALPARKGGGPTI